MTEDQIRRLFVEMRHELERVIHRDSQRLEGKVDDVKAEVVDLKVRVTGLEQKAVRADIKAETRAELAKETAAALADKTAETISARERSRKWWLGIAGAVTGAVVAVTTLTALLAQYLHQ